MGFGVTKLGVKYIFPFPLIILLLHSVHGGAQFNVSNVTLLPENSTVETVVVEQIIEPNQTVVVLNVTQKDIVEDDCCNESIEVLINDTALLPRAAETISKGKIKEGGYKTRNKNVKGNGALGMTVSTDDNGSLWLQRIFAGCQIFIFLFL